MLRVNNMTIDDGNDRDDFSATGNLPPVERTGASDKAERDRKFSNTMTGTVSTVSYQNTVKDEKDLPWHKRKLARKLRYAFIALLVAITLWGYVLMSENPVRIKRIENVSVSFAGGNEADLKARGLIISGDIDTVLTNVDVNVRTTLNDLPRFKNSVGDIVTATVNIGDIREPGTYTRRIAATSSIGAVESVEPSEITITVENYVKRQVPVTCSFEGELPDGYWHDEPSLDTSILEVLGPESTLKLISRAICVVDLSERTDPVFDSFAIDLLDHEGNVIDSSFVKDTVLATVVRMNILPYIDIPLDQYITAIGDLNEDYEISSISINPAFLSVAAPEATLQAIPSSVSIEPINVSEFNETGTYIQKVSMLGLPSDVTLLSDNNFIVTIEVEDKSITTSLTCSVDDANITGRDDQFKYQFTSRNCIVEFTGPARIIKNLTAEDVILEIDVSGLSRGYNELTPIVRIVGDPAWAEDGSVQISSGKIICVLTTAAGA
ncbi:MAG: hypothetical protein II072_05230 [Clostridia bacterium]|nr:hypothetical protein [Clostridia bacterium]